MSSLLTLTDGRRYHLYRKETDMRKSFDSLCGIISNELDKNVMAGDVFIFINKLRTHLKLLVWETGGFSLFYRRLEQGTFELPVFDHDCRSLAVTADQLNFILKGISLKHVKYRSRYQHKGIFVDKKSL
jgi:transposase